jgi:hypothetical protein
MSGVGPSGISEVQATGDHADIGRWLLSIDAIGARAPWMPSVAGDKTNRRPLSGVLANQHRATYRLWPSALRTKLAETCLMPLGGFRAYPQPGFCMSRPSCSGAGRRTTAGWSHCEPPPR